VCGGLDDGSENAALAHELAEHFTVFNYARRGRGDSGDTPPYAVEREIEDIEALITEAGGRAHLYGVSSGGALALEAAATGAAVAKLAVYEVPYSIGRDALQVWQTYVEQLSAALGEGRDDDALELFMRLAGSSDQDVAGAKASPYWPGLRVLAHTLAYDVACLDDGAPPAARLTQITQPTLVATGSVMDPHMGGLQAGFFDHAADVITELIPWAQRMTIRGEGHRVDPKALAPVLVRFFGA
jgi:pimeloyl-ACP methyl ester carboxylesterase